MVQKAFILLTWALPGQVLVSGGEASSMPCDLDRCCTADAFMLQTAVRAPRAQDGIVMGDRQLLHRYPLSQATEVSVALSSIELLQAAVDQGGVRVDSLLKRMGDLSQNLKAAAGGGHNEAGVRVEEALGELIEELEGLHNDMDHVRALHMPERADMVLETNAALPRRVSFHLAKVVQEALGHLSELKAAALQVKDAVATGARTEEVLVAVANGLGKTSGFEEVVNGSFRRLVADLSKPIVTGVLAMRQEDHSAERELGGVTARAKQMARALRAGLVEFFQGVEQFCL